MRSRVGWFLIEVQLAILNEWKFFELEFWDTLWWGLKAQVHFSLCRFLRGEDWDTVDLMGQCHEILTPVFHDSNSSRPLINFCIQYGHDFAELFAACAKTPWRHWHLILGSQALRRHWQRRVKLSGDTAESLKRQSNKIIRLCWVSKFWNISQRFLN